LKGVTTGESTPEMRSARFTFRLLDRR